MPNMSQEIGTFLGLLSVIVLVMPMNNRYMIIETPILLRRMVGDFAHLAKEKV